MVVLWVTHWWFWVDFGPKLFPTCSGGPSFGIFMSFLLPAFLVPPKIFHYNDVRNIIWECCYAIWFMDYGNKSVRIHWQSYLHFRPAKVYEYCPSLGSFFFTKTTFEIFISDIWVERTSFHFSIIKVKSLAFWIPLTHFHTINWTILTKFVCVVCPMQWMWRSSFNAYIRWVASLNHDNLSQCNLT